MSQSICPECGARNASDASQCELCGYPLDPAAVVDDEPAPAVMAGGSGAVCGTCGASNVADARFCSQCGTPLRDDASPAPAGNAQPGGLSRRTGLVIGASALLVVALFLITVVSREQAATMPVAAPAAPAVVPANLDPAPLAPDQAEQVDALRADIEAAEGAARLEKQKALVNLLIGFGRPDHAASVQRAIAEAEGTVDAWRKTGNLYFDWLQAAPEAQLTAIALEAVAAYRRVLEQEPDNLDVRSDMAWAYQYDPQNAMLAIQETNRVLETDPNHVQANFNRGVFLMRISRLDQAVEQFEKVRRIVGEGSPIYDRASRLIDAIRQARREQASVAG